MPSNTTRAICAIFLLAAFWVSCTQAPSNKEEYIQEYQSFVEELDKNQDNYSKNDWKEKELEFKKYQQDLYQQFEDDLSPKDKRLISQYKNRYSNIKSGNNLDISINGLEDLLQEASGFLESGKLEEMTAKLSEELNNAINSQEFQQAIGELQSSWNNEIKGELEQSLQQLNTAIENGKVEEGLQQSIDKLNEVLNDEEIKGDMRNAVEDLKQAMEKMEQKLAK